jgi:hypothetical protein
VAYLLALGNSWANIASRAVFPLPIEPKKIAPLLLAQYSIKALLSSIINCPLFLKIARSIPPVMTPKDGQISSCKRNFNLASRLVSIPSG